MSEMVRPKDYAELEKRLLESAEHHDANLGFELPLEASGPHIDMLREAAAISELRNSVIAFGAPHAASYARDFGFAPGELHPRHYDILAACGARMDDFRPALLSSAQAEEDK